MSRRFKFLLIGVSALLISAPVYASDIVYPGGGTLTQIADGGGTSTIITLVNLDNVAVPYSLYFYSDAGTPLTLSTTAGTSAVISGVLPVGGSTILQTNGGGPTVNEGYGVLVATSPSCYGYGEPGYTGLCQVAGSSVFTLPLSSGLLASASCPLDTGEDYIIALPFDETGDAVSAQTGVALANSVATEQVQGQPYGTGETAYINISFLDENGNAIPTPAGQVDTVILPFGQHTSFMLDSQYPQIIGQKGTVIFKGSDQYGNYYDVNVLGLRATSTQFTSITPMVPCNFTYSPTQGSGCTN